MSADNWTYCPRCVDRARAEGQEVDASESKWRTFREDYEFYGAEEGNVTADYRGFCTSCGLKGNFTYFSRFYTPTTRETA